MKENILWKVIATNMLFVYQALFLITTTWEFFLTVLVIDPARSAILVGLAPSLSAFIIISWAIGIFILAIILVMNPYRPSFLDFRLGIGMIILYMILIILSIINPAISWVFVLNYFVNLAWAISLVYFRLQAKQLARCE